MLKPNKIWKRHFDRVFGYADWVEAALGSEEYDLCLLHDSLGLEAARVVKERYGCPLVYDGVEYPEYSGRSGRAGEMFAAEKRGTALVHRHELEIYRQLDALMVGTRGVAGWYGAQDGVVPAKIVRNCLDYEEVERDDEIRRDCGLKPEDRLVLYPNSVFIDCGVEETVTALKHLPETVHLAIMGWIPAFLGDPLKERIARQGLEGRVHFLDLKGPDDLIRYRSGADIGIIPIRPTIGNHRTMLPNRVFELIMSRVPMLVSSLPYVQEVVETYDCGVVYEGSQPETIARSLEKMLSRLDYYRERMEATAKEMCWSQEEGAFEAAMSPVLSPSDPPRKILCLANKPLTTNRRFYRHTRTLANWGHDITVMALEIPDPQLQVNGVRYVIAEELNDWLRSDDLQKKQKIQEARLEAGIPLLEITANTVHNLQVFPKVFLLDAALRRILPSWIFRVIVRCYKFFKRS
ncbi:glycosyltransferase [Sneathiella limimaris]|uniref:glycosyltransferase n=1 Tax=Sneathiella limimaris TaxID=1964213 RepID=UPI00146D62B5|nr:glycosyltransferase [Sneathiella limimaris]